MTDRPIIFSAPMVRALLAGQKTQTRRLIRTDEHGRCIRGRYAAYMRDGVGLVWRPYGGADEQPMPFDRVCELVGYAPGDRLWVRETFAHATNFPPAVRYYATDDVHELRRKRPAIHMPRWASRLTLTVTQVRVQRLHDITEIDSSDEGAPCCVMDDDGKFYENQGGTYRCGFVGLWNSINGKRTGAAWDDNPWIVALTFTVEKRNIDAKVETAVKKPEAA